MSIPYSLSGRVLYGLAIAGMGVVALIHRDFIHSLQPVPAALPGYTYLAVVVGMILLVAGLGILINFRVRPLALMLTALFVMGIALLHIPGAFREPALLLSPFWIRTFESLALASAALILAGQASNPMRVSWIRSGRVAFGISLPVFGILHFIYPDNVAALVATATPAWPWPLFWAWLTGAGHFAAGIGIATGILARWAAILAGFMYASWALTLHLPRVIDHPAARSMENPAGYGGDRGEFTSLFVCIAFWGAAWIVAGSLSVQRHATAQDS